jgi:hypothetical protein
MEPTTAGSMPMFITLFALGATVGAGSLAYDQYTAGNKAGAEKTIVKAAMCFVVALAFGVVWLMGA